MENRTNRLHNGALKLVYIDQPHLKFQKPLTKDNIVSIYQNNLHALATEIYIAKHKISPELVCDIFQVTNRAHNLKYKSTLA